jgi:prepilin signal peptidase PulO-like enzyme (type II secretory pathway)
MDLSMFGADSPLIPWWPLIAAVLGAIVGSFLNVVILRLPPRLEWSWRQQAREFLGQSAVAGETAPPGLVMARSQCPACQAPIRWYQNVPIVSWLALRGRCAGCRKAISWQYPVVEAVTAAASLAVALKFGWSFEAVAALGFTWTLIALCGIDFRTQLLPDQITLALLWAGLLLSLRPLLVAPDEAIIGGARRLARRHGPAADRADRQRRRRGDRRAVAGDQAPRRIQAVRVRPLPGDRRLDPADGRRLAAGALLRLDGPVARAVRARPARAARTSAHGRRRAPRIIGP